MARMSKAQLRKRLKEATQKIQVVYMSGFRGENMAVTTADMAAIEKIMAKCIARLK